MFRFLPVSALLCIIIGHGFAAYDSRGCITCQTWLNPMNVTTVSRPWSFSIAIWVGFIVLLLVLRSLVLLLASTGELGSGDGPGYFNSALHLIETTKLPPLRIQPHGYPILISPIIAAFNQHPVLAVQIFQVFLDVGLVAVLAAIAWKMLAARSVVLAGLIVAAVSIQPFTATMTNSLYTEPTNTFL